MPGNYTPNKGCTLLIPSGTAARPDTKHLFFALTNPCVGNQHLLVSASSIRDGRVHDATCELAVGDHPFIEAKSYIFYAKPIQLPHQGIIKCVSSAIYVAKEDCNPEVFARIRAGLTESPMTPRWAKEYFRINKDR